MGSSIVEEDREHNRQRRHHKQTSPDHEQTQQKVRNRYHRGSGEVGRPSGHHGDHHRHNETQGDQDFESRRSGTDPSVGKSTIAGFLSGVGFREGGVPRSHPAWPRTASSSSTFTFRASGKREPEV